MPLRNTCSVRSMGTSEKIEKNLISFFDYGFLDLGGYFNISVAQTGDYVSDLSSLTKVQDNRGFTYWAGPKNWVYESGADSSGVYAPAQVYLNGSGSPYTSGIVNYRDGYVYNLPAAATGVKARFSYKWATVVSAKEAGYGRKIVWGYNRPDLDPIGRSGVPEASISLPFISFDVPSIAKSQEYGMGGEYTPKVYTYNIKATVVGESSNDVKRLADILIKQQGFAINTFDPEEATASGDFPLTMRGTLNSGKTHDQLSALYEWNDMFLEEIKASDEKDLNNGLYESVVNMKLKVIDCGC